MNPYLASFLGKHLGKIMTMLVVLALVTTYYSFLGADLVGAAGGVAWVSSTNALIYALGIGVAIFTFWTLALRVVPSLPPGRFRMWGMAVTVAGCIFIVSMSSWLNVAGLAGAAALETHMYQAIGVMQIWLDRVYGQARAQEQVMPDLRAAAAHFGRLADREQKDGHITGSAGPGTVSATLADMSIQLEGLARQVQDYIDAASALSAQGRSHIETMRGIVAGEGGPMERMRQLSRESDAFRAILQEIQGKAPGAATQRVVATLSAGITLQPVSSRNAAVAERQRQALEQVRELADKTAASLSLLAAELDGPDDPTQGAPALEWIGPVDAVWRYAEDYLPMWAGGIAIDLIPTLVILYLMLVFTIREEGKRPQERFEDLSVTQLAYALEANDWLRGAQLPGPPGPPMRPSTTKPPPSRSKGE